MYTPLKNFPVNKIILENAIKLKYIQSEEDALAKIKIKIEPSEDKIIIGKITSTIKFTWYDMYNIWKHTVSLISAKWKAFIFSLVIGDSQNRIDIANQVSSILTNHAKQLNKQYPELNFCFFVLNTSLEIRAFGHSDDNIIFKEKTLLGLGTALTGQVLCKSRNFDEFNGKLSDFFTSSFGFFDDREDLVASLLTFVINRKH